MPLNLIKSYAAKSGKSEDEVEKIWHDTKEIVGRKWARGSARYWALVNYITGRRLGISSKNLREQKIECNICFVSSRVCPLGTKSCESKHDEFE